jgi:hypothetical protein
MHINSHAQIHTDSSAIVKCRAHGAYLDSLDFENFSGGSNSTAMSICMSRQQMIETRDKITAFLEEEASADPAPSFSGAATELINDEVAI